MQKPRKREYLGSYKNTEKHLLALQRDLEEQQQKQQEQNEKNMILAELIYVQERTQAIYDKHKLWLAAGGPTAEEIKLQQQLEVELQVGGCHWCLYALETASWEQLQAALSYDCAQWNEFLNKYFQKLLFLSELLKRSPEQQSQLLQASGINPAPHLPLVYNFQGLTDTLTPAWAAVLEALKSEGCLAILALLHGNMALYEAASRHALTGQECAPSPTDWARLAQRMRFTRLQKLHFKLALEIHARQAQAAAAQGLSALHETPSYAFLLACEAIAAQRQDCEMSPGLAAASGPAAAAAAATAAAAAGCEDAVMANGCHKRDISSNSSHSQQQWTPDAAASCAAAVMHAAMPASPPPAAATAAAAAVAAARAGPPTAAGRSLAAAEHGPAAAAAAVAAAAAAITGGVPDAAIAQGPGAQLQRKMALYLRQWVALNLFLKDTMSPEQNFIMSMGSYPFWPMPASICGAAIQLPDGHSQGVTAQWQDLSEVVQDSIDLLLSQRRYTMAETHDSLLPALMKLQL